MFDLLFVSRGVVFGCGLRFVVVFYSFLLGLGWLLGAWKLLVRLCVVRCGWC